MYRVLYRVETYVLRTEVFYSGQPLAFALPVQTTVKNSTSPVDQSPLVVRRGFVAGKCIMSQPEL